MFTGIVEEIGEIAELTQHDETGGTSLKIVTPATSLLLADAQLGDSIAVNGVCLTVTQLAAPASSSAPSLSASSSALPQATLFRVGIAPETLRVTNLGLLQPGSRVNLERAVRADTRMGGHFVQGHVDGTADVLATAPDGNALTMRLAFAATAPPLLLRYIVYKGYVALDGTSLTVTRVDDAAGWWEVMLVAYTQERVVLAHKRAGDSVNVEVDMMAKYAEKAMEASIARADSPLNTMLRRLVDQRLTERERC